VVTPKTKELADYVSSIGSKMAEAHQTAVVETVVAKTKDEVVEKNLKEVTAIKDSTERRRRLLDLYQNVQSQTKTGG
jgi:hypothetical protein